MGESNNARSEARSAVLGRMKKPATVIVEVRGQKIEVREPTAEQYESAMIDAGCRGNTNGDLALGEMERLARMLGFECSYIPGTGERLFEEADREAYAEMTRNDEARVLGERAFRMAISASVAGKN